MDDESGDNDRDELRSGWGGESRQDSGEADGMNLEVDSKDEVMHDERSMSDRFEVFGVSNQTDIGMFEYLKEL